MEDRILEQNIDELAEIRADLLLLKKQLGRQERTILPTVAKWFYALCVLLMVFYISVGVHNGVILSNIDHNITAFLDTYQLIAE